MTRGFSKWVAGTLVRRIAAHQNEYVNLAKEFVQAGQEHEKNLNDVKEAFQVRRQHICRQLWGWRLLHVFCSFILAGASRRI